MIINLSLSQVNTIRLLLLHLIDTDSSLNDSVLTDIKDILVDLDSASVKFIQSL